MKALFVDGPAKGQAREYPYASSEIQMIERLPVSINNPGGQAARALTYVKFATDHAGRSLFKVKVKQ